MVWLRQPVEAVLLAAREQALTGAQAVTWHAHAFLLLHLPFQQRICRSDMPVNAC